jgi:murein DD-endopeptidase MepM/ murein hydrolase activator NlpD
MRRLLWAVCAVLVVMSLSAKFGGHLPEGWRGAAGVLGLPLGLLSMNLRAADRELLAPVSGVRAAQVKDTWGAARGGGRSHEGQDIFARRGTEVYSATEGYVVRVGENALGGKTVFVHGPGGRSYYYAHLDDYAPGLGVGDYVTPDTLLGYVGDTGNAKGTPPHLHFGVYTSSGAINPHPLLTDRKKKTREP